MKLRVLFVDDEPNVLQGLRRMLRRMRDEWDMDFVDSGQKGLDLVEQRPFDVVVSDMRMPGMDGAEFLTKVMERYPQMVRIVLSGQWDRETTMRCARSAHQYLTKPCDTEALKASLARASGLRGLLDNEALKGAITRMDSLPSMPELYRQIQDEVASPGASLQKVGEIISKDVGMTAKILQLVNSAFFGFTSHVSSPDQAASLLGLEVITGLVLSVHIFSEYEDKGLSGFSLDELWRHSMATGAFARKIAKAQGLEQGVAEDAFMAGVLHDTGRLVLATNSSERYGEAGAVAQVRDIPLWEAEQEVLGTTHAEVGAYLLGLWGLPDAIVEALAYHHCPDRCAGREFSPLTAVHVGNALEHSARSGGAEAAVTHLNTAYLNALGIADQLGSWAALCRDAVAE